MQYLPDHDPAVARIIRQEESRIENTLDLIAAENHAPRSIFEAQGSIFSTKAAEGYPGSPMMFTAKKMMATMMFAQRFALYGSVRDR